MADGWCAVAVWFERMRDPIGFVSIFRWIHLERPTPLAVSHSAPRTTGPDLGGTKLKIGLPELECGSLGRSHSDSASLATRYRGTCTHRKLPATVFPTSGTLDTYGRTMNRSCTIGALLPDRGAG